MPHYVMFLTWQFMALWLGKAVLVPSKKGSICNVTNILSIFFFSCFIGVLGASLYFTIDYAVCYFFNINIYISYF